MLPKYPMFPLFPKDVPQVPNVPHVPKECAPSTQCSQSTYSKKYLFVILKDNKFGINIVYPKKSNMAAVFITFIVVTPIVIIWVNLIDKVPKDYKGKDFLDCDDDDDRIQIL